MRPSYAPPCSLCVCVCLPLSLALSLSLSAPPPCLSRSLCLTPTPRPKPRQGVNRMVFNLVCVCFCACVCVCVRVLVCVRVCVYAAPHLDGYDAEAPLILRRCQHANGTCQLRQVRERYGVQGVEGVAEPGSVFCILLCYSLFFKCVSFIHNWRANRRRPCTVSVHVCACDLCWCSQTHVMLAWPAFRFSCCVVSHHIFNLSCMHALHSSFSTLRKRGRMDALYGDAIPVMRLNNAPPQGNCFRNLKSESRRVRGFVPLVSTT